MKLNDVFGRLLNGKKSAAAIIMLGTAGLCLIMVSSLIPGKKSDNNDNDTQKNYNTSEADSTDYREDAEKKLTEFLKGIDGVGEVEVLVTVGSSEEYVYAKEGKTINSDDRKEEEKKYVMTGGSNGKSALVETVKSPVISGVVIACSGFDSAVVQERVYKSVSTAFNIPTRNIYVTKLQK